MMGIDYHVIYCLYVIVLSSCYALKMSNDPNYVINTTKSWVRAIISRQGEKICPYTIDENAAGLKSPGTIRYAISTAHDASSAHEEYWKEVITLLDSSLTDVATTLLIYPQLDVMSNMEEFDIFSAELDDEIKNRELEETINNVYFHPEFNFRDKDGQVVFIFDDDGNIIGDSSSVVSPSSYARRAPWPIVNILRTQMVQEAQKFVKEGKIFQDNVEKLEKRGSKCLQNMLDSHNWNDLLATKDVEWTETVTKVTNENEKNIKEAIDEIDERNNTYEDNDTSYESDDEIDISKFLDLADKYITDDGDINN